MPCLQGAGDDRPVEEAPCLLRGVSAQAGEHVHVGAVFSLGGGVGGQYEDSQSQGGRCDRKHQRRGVQGPVGGAAAGAASGRLFQDHGIEQPQLQGQRAEVRQLQPSSNGSFVSVTGGVWAPAAYRPLHRIDVVR